MQSLIVCVHHFCTFFSYFSLTTWGPCHTLDFYDFCMSSLVWQGRNHKFFLGKQTQKKGPLFELSHWILGPECLLANFGKDDVDDGPVLVFIKPWNDQKTNLAVMQWLNLTVPLCSTVYRHSSISAVSISTIFDLLQFIILSYFPPL